MDVTNLITEVSFPIFISAYLLFLVTRKIDSIQKSQDLLLIYIGILLGEKGFNIREPQFLTAVQIALDNKSKKEAGDV